MKTYQGTKSVSSQDVKTIWIWIYQAKDRQTQLLNKMSQEPGRICAILISKLKQYDGLLAFSAKLRKGMGEKSGSEHNFLWEHPDSLFPEIMLAIKNSQQQKFQLYAQN